MYVCSVRSGTTSFQYSPVRLELARLVSNLLYGTSACLFSVKTHFRSLEFKGLPPCVFDDASNSKKTSYHCTSLETNSVNVNHVEYKQGFKNDL